MSAFSDVVPGPKQRAVLVGCILTLSALSWLILWQGGDAALGLGHDHQLPGPGGVSPANLSLFVGGWTVMTLAMMLPTIAPVLLILQRFAGASKDAPLLVVLIGAGYVTVWVGFGALAYFLGLLLYGAASAGGWTASGRVGTPFLLLLAGGFQFSSLKYRCLEKCRSPLSFVIGHWRGRTRKWDSLRLGMDHGLFCVGCCWALMQLMLIVSAGAVAWMFVLAAVMAVEKNVSWGRRISAPVGTVLLCWGAWLLVPAP